MITSPTHKANKVLSLCLGSNWLSNTRKRCSPSRSPGTGACSRTATRALLPGHRSRWGVSRQRHNGRAVQTLPYHPRGGGGTSRGYPPSPYVRSQVCPPPRKELPQPKTRDPLSPRQATPLSRRARQLRGAATGLARAARPQPQRAKPARARHPGRPPSLPRRTNQRLVWGRAPSFCPIERQQPHGLAPGPRPQRRGRRLSRPAVGRREQTPRDIRAGPSDWLRSGAKRNAGKPWARPGRRARRYRYGGGSSSSGIGGTAAAGGAGFASERCGDVVTASLRPLPWPGAATDLADPLGGGRGGGGVRRASQRDRGSRRPK